MHVIERIPSKEISFIEQYNSYSNTINFSINEYLSEVNKHSLKQLLLAFLREDILPYHYQNSTVIFDLKRSNYFMYVNRVKLFSLLRFTNFDSLILKHKTTALKQTITDPLKLLDIVKVELGSILNMDQWYKFYNEVANHLQNSLLSTWKKYSIRKSIDRDKKIPNNRPKNILLKSTKVSANGSLQFEQSVFSGHPYHPCAKTKLGFSIEDTVNYSPEFQSKVGIFITAVKKEYVHIEGMQINTNFSEWFAHYYPGAWHIWLGELKKNNLELKNYVPFPVHPWQVYNFTFISPLFKEYLEKKIIVLFDNVKVIASPTLSFRTLLPIEKNAPYIKLPVAIQATSIVRTLSPISTKNMPKISRMLKEILIIENYFSNRLDVLPESYGLHLKGLNIDTAKHFTAIFRENITDYLAENEVAIVVAAFFEKSSISDSNLFIEIMELSGCLTYQDALTYFFNYVELVLGSYLDLYLLYGIALEGHQQNTLAIVQDGKIKRFIARDFDGIEIHIDSFKPMGINLDITDDSPYWQKNKETVRNQLLYTVYQLHLGELVLLLANYFNSEETAFWRIVRQVTEQRFYALKNKMHPSVWQNEFNTILQAYWPVKALLRMRLEKNYLRDGLFYQIVNPLTL